MHDTDKKDFDPSSEDIERVCRFFSLGKLQYFEKEKGVIFYHANNFVFVATTQGQYALKFYLSNTAQSIAIEYAINRILTDHHFLTPIMYTGMGARPYMTSNARLVTCYAYINGVQAWQNIKQRNTIHQINAAMFSLKNIFSMNTICIPFYKEKKLTTIISLLIQASRALTHGDQTETIQSSLCDAHQTYQHHQRLFIRQKIKIDASLQNFLIYKKNIYTIDLSIHESYALGDLADLICSCLMFQAPTTTIRMLVKDYFTQHKIGSDYFPVLNTLLKIKLIKGHLRNIQRERSVERLSYPTGIKRGTTAHVPSSHKLITVLLKRMNDNQKFII